MPIPVVAALVVFISSCIVVDVRTRRIPNVISGAAVLAGVVLNTLYFGGAGLLGSLAGLLAAVGVLLPPFALGGIGGGDVKMMAGVGTLLGPLPTLKALMIGTILGGAIMVVHLARLGRLREKLAATGAAFMTALVTGSLAPLKLAANGAQSVSLPYSIPLGLGAIAVMVMSGVAAGR